MRTTTNRRTLAAITAGAMLALPGAAPAMPADNPTYLEGGPSSAAGRNYSMNSVNGEYIPPSIESTGAAPPGAYDATTGDGFAWGDAAAGAGIALMIGGVALGGRTVKRRRRSVARVSG